MQRRMIILTAVCAAIAGLLLVACGQTDERAAPEPRAGTLATTPEPAIPTDTPVETTPSAEIDRLNPNEAAEATAAAGATPTRKGIEPPLPTSLPTIAPESTTPAPPLATLSAGEPVMTLSWEEFFERQEHALRASGPLVHTRVQQLGIGPDGEMIGWTGDIWMEPATDRGRIELWPPTGEDEERQIFGWWDFAFMVGADGSLTSVTNWGDSSTDDLGADDPAMPIYGCIGLPQRLLDFQMCGSVLGQLSRMYGSEATTASPEAEVDLVATEFRGQAALVAIPDGAESSTDAFFWYVHPESFLPLGMQFDWPAENGAVAMQMLTVFEPVPAPATIQPACFDPASLGIMRYTTKGVEAHQDLGDVHYSLGQELDPGWGTAPLTVIQAIPGCHRPDEVRYDFTDVEFQDGAVILHSWSYEQWEVWAESLWIAELRSGACSTVTEYELPDGRAELIATYEESELGDLRAASSTACPDHPRNRFLAIVYFDDAVVTVNVPVTRIDESDRFTVESGPYRSVEDLIPIVDAIQPSGE